MLSELQQSWALGLLGVLAAGDRELNLFHQIAVPVKRTSVESWGKRPCNRGLPLLPALQRCVPQLLETVAEKEKK